MGMFKSLFRKDWGAALERAEWFLARGDAVQAMEIARRAERSAGGPLQERAAALAERARDEVLASALARATEAESEGTLEDAADWLLAAIEQARDEGQIAELEARRASLLERAEEGRNPFPADHDPAGEESGEIEVEGYYHTLVSMLDEEVAPRYAGRSTAFQQAYIDLNDGRAEEARQAFEVFLAEEPEDPVLRLERGRARLLVGEAEAAREDLEAAWESFGAGPLDASGALSVPGLWAEAALAQGDPEAVVHRLEPLADPEEDSSEICHLFASALVALNRRDEAQHYLQKAIPDFPSDPRFSLLLAGVLASSDQLPHAIACLEAAVAPSCTGGTCSGRAKHLPSLRALATLHLEQGEDLDRVGELMAIVAHAQGGRLGASDHSILARYYRRMGDAAAAEHSEAEAARLAQAVGGGDVQPAPLVGGQKRRVL